MVGCDREKTGQMLYDQPRAVIDGPGNRECASIPYLKSQGRMKTMRDPVRGFVSDRLMVQRKLDRCRLVVRRDSIACSIFPRVQRNPRMPLRLVISSFLFAFGLDALSLSRQAAAAQIPGESQTGILYAITHLHPIAYIIL
ncbi:MAG: hypothetical protein LDL33_03090, partial [Desulfomonile sp.]|nr:hypothetical protein [Desulfomonile sp.]